jgi:ubiquinone/menaquinone biosynthesis C-methylase UbiE
MPTTFDFERVDIQHHPVSDVADTVRLRYQEIFGDEPEDRGGWYHPADWRRTSYVLDLLRSGGKVLDVGAGAGQFMNMLALSGRFSSVTALDHTRFRKYTELGEVTRVDGSIAELPFDDDHFDVVTCMEVLEHIPTEIFDAGLAELRRVCAGQLVMTVPFEEPEPLSKGHVRRFEATDIREIFPDARSVVLDRPRKPWILMLEHLDGTPFDDLRAQAANDRIAELEREIARLKSRKSLRAANYAGAQARRVRTAVRRLRPT